MRVVPGSVLRDDRRQEFVVGSSAGASRVHGGSCGEIDDSTGSDCEITLRAPWNSGGRDGRGRGRRSRPRCPRLLPEWIVSRSSWIRSSRNLARARWRVLRNASGRTVRAGDLAELLGDLLDRGLGMIAAELEDGGVAVLGRRRLVGLEPRPDALDHGLAPDAVEVLVGSAGSSRSPGGSDWSFLARKWSMISRWRTVRR